MRNKTVKSLWLAAICGAAICWALQAAPCLFAQEIKFVPPEGSGATDDIKTREQRIKYHQERVAEMLKVRREAQEAAEAAAQKPPPPAPPTPKPPVPPPAELKVEEKPPVAPESASLLQIDPLSQSVLAGEAFDTRVVVMNDQYAKYDDVEIYLKYPPQALQLMEVSDANVRKHTKSEPVYENDPTSGVVYYRNKITSPYHFKNEELLQLRWKAVIPLTSARIEFIHNPPGEGERTTSLRCFSVDQLGSKDKTTDGTMDGEIVIDLPEKRLARPIFANAAVPTKGGIKLRMRSDAPWSRVGRQFTVTVSLDNPRSVFMDTVRIRMWFDPGALEMLDWDRGNWIRRGVNAQDTFAHQNFPFAFHRANEADNQIGEFNYEMGMADRFVPPSADLFRIKFRTLGVRTENWICFDITSGKEGPATALLAQGSNVLDYGELLKGNDLILNIPVLPALKEEEANSDSLGAPEKQANAEKPTNLGKQPNSEKPAGVEKQGKPARPELPRSSYDLIQPKSNAAQRGI